MTEPDFRQDPVDLMARFMDRYRVSDPYHTGHRG
jgi:hypothetical protein